ncbi:MAG: LPP20 family lipoprotein [Nitrospirales bacterium]
MSEFVGSRCYHMRLLASLGLLSLLANCSFLGGQPMPDWIEGRSQQFPREQYLVGRGEADSRESAEQRAYAAIARIFSARVKAQLRDSEVYTQWDREDQTTTNRQLSLDHLTQVSTEKVLEDVQVLDAWYQSEDERYFALAGLNRAKAERVLVERISEYDRAIEVNLEDGRNSTDVLAKIRGLKRALRDLRRRKIVNADLQIVRLTGEGARASYSVADIQRELHDYLLTDVRIDVKIAGEQQLQIQQAVREGLKREGFVTLGQRLNGSTDKDSDSTLDSDPGLEAISPDLLITGITRIDDLRLFDPLFKYVRWCSDLQILEPDSQRIIGVISRSGKEGHITQQEARVRAIHAMQGAVSSEISQSLARYIYDDGQMSLSSSASCLPPN